MRRFSGDLQQFTEFRDKRDKAIFGAYFRKGGAFMIKFSENALKNAFERSVGLIHHEISERCPVRTGRLKKSLNYTAEENYGEIKTDVEYAALVEFGAAGRRPKAFMKNGLSAAKVQIAEIYREEILND